MLSPRRLRAPATDAGLLAEPPLINADALALANRERLATWDHDFQGRPARWLRERAREEILEAATAFEDRFGLGPQVPATCGPWIVTGHQPELFHPGVWIKNFATAGLASRLGGVGLNLIVDDDIPKRAGIRVPTRLDGVDLGSRWVEFDEQAVEAPYEDWAVRSEATFRDFPARVRAVLGDLVPDPILDAYWPLVLEQQERTDRIGLRFAIARAALERRWGVANAELPLSLVCQTEAFAWFVAHLLAHLPRFQQVHNDAQLRYRRLYKIRSKNHPVPALGGDGDWLEAPFWAWRAESPRRRPLLARARGREIDLRIAGESEPFLTLPLGADRDACCAIEPLRELAGRQIRLRTRALTTTMFARLLVGDLFLHGIGGAKYDELGDELCRGFFGFEPPPYLTVSMTLRLGLPTDPATAASLESTERRRRDLEFNPERYLPEPRTSEQQRLVAAKQEQIAAPQESHAQRVARFHAFRTLNAELARPLGPLREQLDAECGRLAQGLRRNTIASSREYAAVLHSQRRWLEVVRPFGPAAMSTAST